MRVDLHIRDTNETVKAIIRGLDNGLTASENMAPEGTEGQVLMSNGPGAPPSYQALTEAVEDILRSHGLI